MKINPSRIVIDHWSTFTNAETNRRSIWDFLIFYGLPACIAIMLHDSTALASKDFYNISITFFGIFIALLLNLQVAVFGIFQRKWQKNPDEHLSEIQLETLQMRTKLLGEINCNISYSIFFSTVSLFIFLVLYSFLLTSAFFGSLSAFIYIHFLFTILMIIKRAHALFEREYR